MCAAVIHVPAHAGMIDPSAMDEGPHRRNQFDLNASIALLELTGLSYRKRKNDTSSSSANGLPVGRFSRMGRKPTRLDVETREHMVASTPQAIVVWLLQNDATIDTEAPPTYLCSSPMTEEAMDDEGNVFSWRCAWPDANMIHSHLPLDRGSRTEYIISLGVGLQLPGRNQIQPLGVATVAIPEDRRSESELLMSVNVSKQRTRTFGSRSKGCEYTISPSTMLKIKVHTPTNKESSERIDDTSIHEIEISNASTPTKTENDREIVPVDPDAQSAVSAEPNSPLALLRWGSHCKDEEKLPCTKTGRMVLTDMTHDVEASGSAEVDPSQSTKDSDSDALTCDTKSVVSESSAKPAALALLMWGSQCEGEEDLSFTNEGSMTHDNITQDLVASGTETQPSQSTMDNNHNQDLGTVALTSDAKSVVSESSAKPEPLALLMWGSQCQDEEDSRKLTKQSSDLIASRDNNICEAYALMEEIGKMEPENHHAQQPQVSKMAHRDINEVESKDHVINPRDKHEIMSRDSKGVSQKRPVNLKHSTEHNPQVPDILKIVKKQMLVCGKKVNEVFDNASSFLSNSVSCGGVFDGIVDDVERSVKKTHESWNCSCESTKNYVSTQLYGLSKAVSFGSTQCSDDTDASFSSQSTEAARRTDRLMALVHRGSTTKRHIESSRRRVESHQVERRFIRLPLAIQQNKSGYKFKRNVSVCSV